MGWGVVLDSPDDATTNAVGHSRETASTTTSRCMGTLVSPTRVLTARHCLRDTVGAVPNASLGGLARTGEGPDPKWIFRRDVPVAPSSAYQACFATWPAFDPNLRNAGEAISQSLHRDVALIRMNRRVPVSIAQPKRIRFEVPSGDPVSHWTGQEVTVFGTTTAQQRQRAPATVEGIEDYAESFGDPFDMLRITGPLGAGNADPARNVQHEPGDSGSPVIHDDGSSERVVGVLSSSRSTGDEAGTSFAVLLPDTPVGDWLEAQLDPDGNGLYVGDLPGPAGVPDADGDGIPDSLEAEFDPDDDGIPSRGFVHGGYAGEVVDNCPLHDNEDQRDNDCDGVGDACDNCAPSGFSVTNVHNTDCGGGADCFNPAQANCNAYIESKTDHPDGGKWLEDPAMVTGRVARVGVGDACDPIPCGESRLQERSVVTAGGGGTVEYRTDIVRTDGHTAPGPDDFRMGLRWCTCDGSGTSPGAPNSTFVDSCAKDIDFGGDQCGVDDPATYYATGMVRGALVWRKMTVDAYQVPAGSATTVTSTGPALGREATYDFEPATVTARWDWNTRTTWDYALDGPAWGFLDEVPGVLWTHVVGSDTTTDLAVDVRARSNHYVFDEARSTPPLGPLPAWCFRFYGRAAPDIGLGLRGLSFPEFPEPAMIHAFDCVYGILEGPPRLRYDEYERLADSLFDLMPPGWPAPDPGWWGHSAEAEELLPPGGVRNAAVSSDGRDILALFVRTPGARLVEQSITVVGPRPPARQGFEVTISARRQTLWMAGGTSGGVPQTDVWSIDLDAGVWERVADLHDQLSQVRAVTYSAVDDLVLVLGETLVDGVPTIRLVAVEPGTSGGSVVGQWARTGTDPDFGMAADVAGHVYVLVGDSHGYDLLRFTSMRDGFAPVGVVTTSGAGFMRGTMAGGDVGATFFVVSQGVPDLVGHAGRDMAPLIDPSLHF